MKYICINCGKITEDKYYSSCCDSTRLIEVDNFNKLNFVLLQSGTISLKRWKQYYSKIH